MKSESVLLYGFKLFEKAIHVVFPYMTALTKKRIDKDVLVIDCGDITKIIELLDNKNVKVYLKIFSELSTKMYPSNSRLIHIINAPAAIQTFWPLIQGIIPANAKSLVILHKKDYQEELFKHIDPKHLPDIAGGEVKDWPNTKLPWTDYLNYC